MAKQNPEPMTTCASCIHRGYHSVPKYYNVCKLMPGKQFIDTVPIPDWCPLPDSTPPTREELRKKAEKFDRSLPIQKDWNVNRSRMQLLEDFAFFLQSEIPTRPTKESINQWLLKNHPLTPNAFVRNLDSDEFRRVVTDYIHEYATGIQSEESLKIQSDFNKVSHTLDYLIEEKKQEIPTGQPKQQPDHIVEANKMIQQPEAREKRCGNCIDYYKDCIAPKDGKYSCFNPR